MLQIYSDVAKSSVPPLQTATDTLHLTSYRYLILMLENFFSIACGNIACLWTGLWQHGFRHSITFTPAASSQSRRVITLLAKCQPFLMKFAIFGQYAISASVDIFRPFPACACRWSSL